MLFKYVENYSWKGDFRWISSNVGQTKPKLLFEPSIDLGSEFNG